MKRIFCGLLAGSILSTNPAFAGQPVLVDGKGHALAFVKVHGIKRGGYIYTPYSAKFGRGGIHCDDTGTNISPSCDVGDTTIYGGD